MSEGPGLGHLGCPPEMSPCAHLCWLCQVMSCSLALSVLLECTLCSVNSVLNLSASHPFLPSLPWVFMAQRSRKSTGAKQKDHSTESEARELIQLPEHWVFEGLETFHVPNTWVCRFEGCWPMEIYILLEATDTSLQPTIEPKFQCSLSSDPICLLYLLHECQTELG